MRVRLQPVEVIPGPRNAGPGIPWPGNRCAVQLLHSAAVMDSQFAGITLTV